MAKKKPPESLPKLSLSALLSRGYFPVELPPGFTTSKFARAITVGKDMLPEELTDAKKGKWCDYSAYSLARPALLRRRLAIANPIPYYRLAAAIVAHQDELLRKARASIFCLPKPTIRSDGSLTRSPPLDAVPPHRALVRFGKHVILYADVSRFYPSVYTHAIEWALSSKEAAKKRLRARPAEESVGAKIDSLVQACQSGQTRGVPIGPVSSMLLAEIILSQVDARLEKEGIRDGFRFIDDYELVFTERSKAERALTVLEDALAEFELELNPLKTKICDLPQELDNPGIQEIRAFPRRDSHHRTGIHLGQDLPSIQPSDLLHLFTRAFARQREFPDKSILRYTVSSLSGVRVSSATAELLQALILQAVMHEPGVWPFAIKALKDLHETHASLSEEAVRETIHAMIKKCAPVKHSSEVAWSLWAALVFDIVVTQEAVEAVAQMVDDCCSILLFHAAKRNLTEIPPPSQAFQESFTPESLRGPHWLLSYELAVQGWVSLPKKDHIAEDAVFSFLRDQNVRFYDADAVTRLTGRPDEEEDEEEGEYFGGY